MGGDISIDRDAIHEFHYQVRHSVRSSAGVQHAGDVGMFQARQNLPFLQEAADDFAIQKSAPDDFDGDLEAHIVVVAFSQENVTHAAGTDARENPVRSQLAGWQLVLYRHVPGFDVKRGELPEGMGAGIEVGADQPFQCISQFGQTGALLIEEEAAFRLR